jgi:hypothetical protein
MKENGKHTIYFKQEWGIERGCNVYPAAHLRGRNRVFAITDQDKNVNYFRVDPLGKEICIDHS